MMGTETEVQDEVVEYEDEDVQPSGFEPEIELETDEGVLADRIADLLF